MLIDALMAGLPMIYVWTTDPINAVNIIGYHAQDAGLTQPLPTVMHPSAEALTRKGNKLTKVNVVRYVPDDLDQLMSLYDRMSTHEFTLVVVGDSPHNPLSFAFNAGRLMAPERQVRDMFAPHTDPNDLEEVIALMSTIDLSRQVEICYLCQASGGMVTAKTAQEWRSKMVGHVRGIEQLHPNLDHYVMPAKLGEWLAENKRYFLQAPHGELVPRDLLLDGPPGTGKTKGAMAVAYYWELPLYRVNLGACLSRWTGDAEANLSTLLDTLDRQAPCVALLDELEKVFQATDVEGSIGRMLGELLWWMAEHTSRVLVVATTNHLDRVPTELYRPGRIDETFYFDNLKDVSEAIDLATVVWNYFTEASPKNLDGSKSIPPKPKVMPKDLRDRIAALASQENGVSHVEVSQTVIKAVKALNLL